MCKAAVVELADTRALRARVPKKDVSVRPRPAAQNLTTSLRMIV